MVREGLTAFPLTTGSRRIAERDGRVANNWSNAMTMRKSTRRELRKLRELVRVLLDGKVCCFCKEPLLDNTDFLPGNGEGFQIGEQISIHHRDGNHGNNDPRNLKFVHRTCHKRHHARLTFSRR